MRTRLFLAAGTLTLAALVVPALTACSPLPVNLVLITLDTTRVDVIGAFGGPKDATPNLDRLAREGVKFTRAMAVTPLTIPAHSSILTGQYPPRHGVRDNGDFFLGPDAVTLPELLKARGYRTMASVGAEVTSHHWGFDQGFDAYFDDMGGAAGSAENRWRVERPGTDVLADALGWLGNTAATDPGAGAGTGGWFAWLHFFDAHHPYTPPEPYASRFPDKPYLAEVAALDGYVGQLLTALERTKELDSTCVVVLSDHGESLGAHGEATHGVLLYDETTHIPMIAWCGKHASLGAPRVVDTPVSQVDVLPTMLGMLGRSGANAATADNVDGLDVLAGSGPPATRSVYSESLYALRHYGWSRQRAWVTNTDKLLDSTTPELYGRGDRGEKQDLAASRAARVDTLRGEIDGFAKGLAPSGGAQRADMDAERTAQLEALGYVTGASGTLAEDTPNLPDPVQRLPVLKDVEVARAAIRTGDLAVARTTLEALVAAEPGLGEPQSMLASVRARMGDVDGALAVLEAQDARQPTAQGRAMMGAFLLQRGDLARAVPLLQDATTRDPYLAMAWTPYLHALLISNDPRLPDEVARARKALPDAVGPRAMEGATRALKGDLAGAEPLVVAALAADPTQPFLSHALGLILRASKPDAAETAFLEEVRLHPSALPSRRALVALYAEQKRYDEQAAQLDALLAALPDDAESLHASGQALFNLKRYADAGKRVDACLVAAPEHAACTMLQANVLDKLGKKDAARAAYERALALRTDEKGR